MSSTFYFDSVLHLYLMKGSDHFISKYYSLSPIFVTHTALISIFYCCIHTHIINRKKYRTMFMVLIDGQDLQGKTTTSCFFIIDKYCFCYSYCLPENIFIFQLIWYGGRIEHLGHTSCVLKMTWRILTCFL